MTENPFKTPIPKPPEKVVCPYCRGQVAVHAGQAGWAVGCPYCGGQFQVPGTAAGMPMNSHPTYPSTPADYQAFVDKKVLAGVCGIIFGGLGIHKFILGFPGAGTIMMVFWLMGLLTGMCIVVPLVATVAMNIIGLVEGITYLSKSDDEFYRIYSLQRKEWF